MATQQSRMAKAKGSRTTHSWLQELEGQGGQSKVAKQSVAPDGTISNLPGIRQHRTSQMAEAEMDVHQAQCFPALGHNSQGLLQ